MQFIIDRGKNFYSIYLMRVFILTVMVVFAKPALPNGLVWEQETIEIQAIPESTEVQAIFKFTNNSNQPVEFLSVQTSCGCTKSKLDKKYYQPGESGSIAVEFEFGHRKGLQRKPVIVKTKGIEEGTTVLTLLVDIPEVIKMYPNNLVWYAQKERDPRQIRLFVVHEAPINIVNVTAVPVSRKYINQQTIYENSSKESSKISASTDTLSDESEENPLAPIPYVTNLEIIEQGREYLITVIPPTNQELEQLIADLIIQTDFPSADNSKIFKVPLRIISLNRNRNATPRSR